MRSAWSPAMLDHFATHAIDPAVAAVSGLRERRGRLVAPESGATWRVGPEGALGALLCEGEDDTLATASVLFSATRGKLRYRPDLPQRLYELAPVAILDTSSAARVALELREAHFESVHILTPDQGEESFSARLRWELFWLDGMMTMAAIAPDRGSLCRTLSTIPAAERATYLARLVRRGVVAELRRALGVLADAEPEIVCDLLSAHPELLDADPKPNPRATA